jgi:hypothetical protein
MCTRHLDGAYSSFCLLLAFAGKSVSGRACTGCSCSGCTAASRSCHSGVPVSVSVKRDMLLHIFLPDLFCCQIPFCIYLACS